MKQLIVFSIVFISSISFSQDTVIYIPYTEVEQSVEIIYESSAFNIRDFVNNGSTNHGTIKNIFLNYTIYLSQVIQLSFKLGYGWNNYNNGYSGLTD